MALDSAEGDTRSDGEELLRRQLAQVDRHEAAVRPNPVTGAMRAMGRTRGFSSAYRRVGPVIDPYLMNLWDGKLFSKVYGLSSLLLHSTGAKSGLTRTNPLLYVRDGIDFVVLGTNFGQAKHPGWTANLRAHPSAVVEIGGARVKVTAERCGVDEFQRLFPQFVAMYPGYDNYMERRESLPPRMFVLRPYA